MGDIYFSKRGKEAQTPAYESLFSAPKINFIENIASNDLTKKNKIKKEPGPPTNLVAVPYDGIRRLYDSVHLKVSWKEPAVGKKCIQHYVTDLTSDLSNCGKRINGQKTNNTSTIITDLCPCTSYWVKVKAIDRDNGSGSVAQAQSKPTKSKGFFFYYYINLQNNCLLKLFILIKNF